MLFIVCCGLVLGALIGLTSKTQSTGAPGACIQSSRQELLCLGKNAKKTGGYTRRVVTLFYKGITVNVEDDSLYEFAKPGEKIAVNVTREYKKGKDISFVIEPLDEREYIEIYKKDEMTDEATSDNAEPLDDCEYVDEEEEQYKDYDY